MNKRKDNDHLLLKKIVKTLSTIFAIGFFCFFCTAFTLLDIPTLVTGYIHLYKMTTWELPPESRFVEFKAYQTTGGTTCFIQGELVIETKQPYYEIKEFYVSRYQGEYQGNVYGELPVIHIGILSDGRQLYRISAFVIRGGWGCY